MAKKNKINFQLLGIIFCLLVFGLAALYSASTVESLNSFGNTTHYIIHQLIYGVGIGLIVMLALSKIDYHRWQKLLPLIIFVALALLAMVKAPGFGFSAGCATRWIHVGPLFFQPSELAKLAIVLYLAAWAAKTKGGNQSFVFGVLPSLIIVGLFSLLILWQPDFGTMVILIAISATMLFTSGMSLKHFTILGLISIVALIGLIKFEPYRYDRLVSFLNPGIDPQGSSYQINQALLSIGAGGSGGYGYGLSRQKYNYLPEPMGDSIFAVTAEELGFFRVLVLLGLFLLFFFKGLKIAKNAPDIFGKMAALGLTVWVTFQALVNIGAMAGIFPLTGVPLPFFSFGSSSMLMLLADLGILLNISRQAKT